MKIAVLGASGNFGSLVVARLGEQGHEVVEVSRGNGVDVSTGHGLPEALRGVEVVVDCLNSPSLRGGQALEFFTTAAENVVHAAREANVGRIVCLSIAGAADPRVNARFGYYKAKAAQESVYQQAEIATTTVRSTQWHEFVPAMVPMFTKGPVCLLPTMLIAPAAASSVAAFVADVATSPHEARNDILAVRGPEEGTLAEFARRYQQARGEIGGEDPRTIRDAPVLGRGIAQGGLVPQDAHVDTVTFEEWLRS